jgi:hypothetical protein
MESKRKSIEISNDLLSDIEIAMESSEVMEWYLDLGKGELALVSDYKDDDDDTEELIENDIEGERFISVPARSSGEGWKQMEQFILSLENLDKNIRDLLLVSIQGRGAFSRFKDSLLHLGLIDEWYAFKERLDRKDALDWLLSEGLISEDDVEKGMELLDKLQAERRWRKEGIAKMNKGTKVICIDNSGHFDKITQDKSYDVLDERSEHLLIRIKDDSGKECWLPKSHFKLCI